MPKKFLILAIIPRRLPRISSHLPPNPGVLGLIMGQPGLTLGMGGTLRLRLRFLPSPHCPHLNFLDCNVQKWHVESIVKEARKQYQLFLLFTHLIFISSYWAISSPLINWNYFNTIGCRVVSYAAPRT